MAPCLRAFPVYRVSFLSVIVGFLREAGKDARMIRYAAAACQTDLPNPLDRRQMIENTRLMQQIGK